MFLYLRLKSEYKLSPNHSTWDSNIESFKGVLGAPWLPRMKRRFLCQVIAAPICFLFKSGS